jgi:serine phosphatase RsbU (regulator of sigma subunit)
VGDVRGKGLDAVEIAADVLGVFREVAHEVYTLAEVARRIDASLARRPAAPLEEFVTAVLAEIDPAAGSLTIYNCGHPPPLVLSPGESDGQGPARRLRVTPVNVPAPALPLRLMSLGDTSGAERTVPLQPGDALLLYTDGVTEARNARREFYPLEERVAEVAARAGGADGDLLDRLRDDLVRYVGAPLDDDAALLLARVSGPWDRRAVPPPLAAAPQP